MVFRLSSLRLLNSVGWLFSHREAFYQLARVQFYVFPAAADQFAMGSALALPYGWWEYQPRTMMGLHIGAWSGLPIEAVFVWFAVTFTTVITYDVIKIWKALGTRALEAFFGIRK